LRQACSSSRKGGLSLFPGVPRERSVRMTRISLLLLPLLIGCSAIPPAESPIELPGLVHSSPLPQIVSLVPGGGMKFTVRILVLKDGKVGDVRLVDSSGDPTWDSLAVESIRKWQFTPARRDGEPMALWIRQPLLVEIRDPMMRSIGQLVCETMREADSLYALMQQGEEFDSLVRRAGIRGSGIESAFVGSTDISIFSPLVRGEIQSLRENEITRPLKYGSRYVIFKKVLL